MLTLMWSTGAVAVVLWAPRPQLKVQRFVCNAWPQQPDLIEEGWRGGAWGGRGGQPRSLPPRGLLGCRAAGVCDGMEAWRAKSPPLEGN